MALLLGVNVDHVATLRQARYALDPEHWMAEPDPVEAALWCEAAGAHAITAHLREDRRHMQDRDMWRLRERIATRLNFEMGNTPGILEIALAVRPDDVCLVPEQRSEVTTEGGLDVAGQQETLVPTVDVLKGVGIRVSLFVDPDPPQIEAAARVEVPVIELHTGAFANARGSARERELERLIAAVRLAHGAGLVVNAGHGIHYDNLAELLRVPYLQELNIGHAIMARAMRDGMAVAVRAMLDGMAGYTGGAR